jgi:hypothetical protein
MRSLTTQQKQSNSDADDLQSGPARLLGVRLDPVAGPPDRPCLDGYVSQIHAQRGETKTVRDGVLHASLEMEKINIERHDLIEDWK